MTSVADFQRYNSITAFNGVHLDGEIVKNQDEPINSITVPHFHQATHSPSCTTATISLNKDDSQDNCDKLEAFQCECKCEKNISHLRSPESTSLCQYCSVGGGDLDIISQLPESSSMMHICHAQDRIMTSDNPLIIERLYAHHPQDNNHLYNCTLDGLPSSDIHLQKVAR